MPNAARCGSILVHQQRSAYDQQQELQTHIAASVAERRDVRASVAEAIGAEGRRIRAETRRMRVHLGRLQLRIASWEEQAHNDFEGLERERAA